MEQAVQDERIRRDAAAAEAARKRSMPSTEMEHHPDAKRIKLEHPVDISGSGTDGADVLAEFIRNFDFSVLPVGLVADLVIANLQILSEPSLTSAIEVIHRHFRSNNS